ncbi:serine/threonine-protein kinase [Demequina capsici]|uniref:Serine/threonine-protein kinase n=1 Tax=Demequina capsici TaxID=3075620 RepID=A0AA96F7C9_9MICO|nr:serine/threonine-protein kinase [Demequina sp. OYTSA14]WNM24954.1 serine/threonine-protein kinase [Demequina sp. OYTSA14]
MAGLRREIGDEIGGYVVRGILGRGGSGTVYLVEDGAGSQAALKLVDAAADPVAAERLTREVHALQSLRHPAVPRVLDAELEGDETFVVSEYIPGLSLYDHVQRHGPMRGAALADLADRIGSALQEAHAAGVVHRDVTPSNVMMGPHGPVLIDFGLAHRTEDSRLTRDGLVSGTAGYVAPEVIDGAEPGRIGDDWAWAATVAYAMKGEGPFGSGSGAISRTLDGRVDLPDVPGASLVAAALSRDIGARPAPAEVVAALRGATEVLPSRGAAPTLVAPAAGTAVLPAGSLPWETAGDPTALLDGASYPAVDIGEPGADVDDDDLDGEIDDDDAAEDEGPWDALDAGLVPAPASSRPVMLAAWAIAASATAALAPVVVVLSMVGAAVVARGVHRRAASLAAARARRGARRGDAVVHTIGMPWHLARGAVELLPSVLLGLAVGLGTGAFAWWLVSASLVASPTTAGQAWGHASAVALGALAACATLWVGPWSEGTRDGARRVAFGLAPTRGVAVAWVIVAIAAVGVVAVAVYALAEPWWWPLREAPGTG